MAGFSREDLLKQFPLAVVDSPEGFLCPSCGRVVQHGQEKCFICNQTLSWENLQTAKNDDGERLRGTISFALSPDFVKGNCRKCPISYIAKDGEENRYTCPLAGKHQENCPMVISKEVIE